jgi:hypothetical protein
VLGALLLATWWAEHHADGRSGGKSGLNPRTLRAPRSLATRP